MAAATLMRAPSAFAGEATGNFGTSGRPRRSRTSSPRRSAPEEHPGSACNGHTGFLAGSGTEQCRLSLTASPGPTGPGPPVVCELADPRSMLAAALARVSLMRVRGGARDRRAWRTRAAHERHTSDLIQVRGPGMREATARWTIRRWRRRRSSCCWSSIRRRADRGVLRQRSGGDAKPITRGLQLTQLLEAISSGAPGRLVTPEHRL
jgi:hypothetical protein